MSVPVAIQGIRDELQCAICHELCTEPKTLPCLHSFCYECLEKWVKAKTQLENNSDFLKEFLCPFCMMSSDLSSGPSSLPTNFQLKGLIQKVKNLNAPERAMCDECVEDAKEKAISYCNTCKEALCSFHVEVHRKSRAFVGHNVTALEQSDSQIPEERRREQQPKTPTGLMMCSQHKESLQWYCMSHEVPICIHCTAKDHKTCSFDFITDRLVQEEREMIEDGYQPLKEMIPRVEECCSGLEQCLSKLNSSKQSMSNEIREMTEQQEHELRMKSQLLLARVDDKYVEMKKELEFHWKEVQQLKDLLCSSFGEMQNTVGTATDVNLLKTKKQLLAQSENLQELFKKADLKLPKENGDMRSHYTLEHSPVVFGHMRERVKSIKHQVTPPVVEQNVEMTVKVTTQSVLEQPLKAGGATCEGYFHHHDQATHTISCDMTDHKDGTYSLLCVPRGYGPGKVTIRFPLDDVQETCIDVNVVRSYCPLQPNPSSLELHCSPWGVAVLRNNLLAVSTSERDVKIYDINTQQHVSTVRSNFVRPYAMVEDKEGNMWVTDREAHNIQKFRRNGENWEKVVQIGNKGREEGKFAHPRGIAIHPKSGLVYVSDMRNHRIQVFLDDQRTGEPPKVVNSFGSHGTETGQLDQPASLVFNKQGQLVVCDDRNSRLQLFTRDGNYVESIGVTQDGVGLLCSPIGVALDRHGRYIVGEFGSHAITFLDSNGKLLSSIRTAGGVGEFLRPRGVAVDESGRIYIADFQNERMVIL